MAEFDARILRYEVNGAPAAEVITREINFTSPLDGTPALSFIASRSANGGTLPDYAEYAFEYNSGTGWVEPENARFIGIKQSYDDLQDDDRISVQCIDIATFYLRKEVMPEAVQTVQAPGSAIGQAVVAAQARGWAPGLTFTFDAAEDSSGDPWSSDEALVLNYSFGTSIDSVLSQFIANEQLAIRRQGRTINLWEQLPIIVGSLGDFPEVGTSPTARPVEKSTDELSTVVRVKGEDAAYDVSLAGAPTATFGRLVTTVDGGLATSAQATKIGTVAGRNLAAVQRQYTVTEESTASQFVPFGNFRVGVMTDVRGGEDAPAETRKLVEIQVRKQPDGVIFFDYTFDFLKRDKIAAIVGNTNTSPNPVGTTPLPPSSGGGGGGGFYAFITNMSAPGGQVQFAFEESPGTIEEENIAALGINVNGSIGIGSRVVVIPIENSVDGVTWQVIDVVTTEVPESPPVITPPAGTWSPAPGADPIYGPLSIYTTANGWKIFSGIFSSTGTQANTNLGSGDSPLLGVGIFATSGTTNSFPNKGNRSNGALSSTGTRFAVEASGLMRASANSSAGVYPILNGFAYNNSNDPAKIFTLNAAGTVYAYKDSTGLVQIQGDVVGLHGSASVDYFVLPPEIRPASRTYLRAISGAFSTTQNFVDPDGSWQINQNYQGYLPQFYEAAGSTLTWNTILLQNEYIHGSGALNDVEWGAGPLQYAVHPEGFVIMKGIAYGGLAGQAMNLAIPAEFRPPYRTLIYHPKRWAATTTTAQFGIAQVDPTGFIFRAWPAEASNPNIAFGGYSMYAIA